MVNGQMIALVMLGAQRVDSRAHWVDSRARRVDYRASAVP